MQRHTIEVLHGDERLIPTLPNLMNGTDVQMIQGGGRARLAMEALQSLRIQGDLAGRNFRATNRPREMSSALYTTPIPPPPSFSTTR